MTITNLTEFEFDLSYAGDLVAFISDELGIANNMPVDVTFVCEDVMARLHVRYMGLPGPTDVLSFPATDLVNGPLDPQGLQNEPTLGDIVICPVFVARNTQSERTQMNIDACIVHGTLHLLGYDHQNNADAAAMSRLENQLTRGWAQLKR